MSFLSGAVWTAMQYAPDACGSVRNYMNPSVGVKPSVRAEYVEAVNRVLPEGRKNWSTQQMFLFLSTFTRLNQHCPGTVQWWRDKEDIVSLVVRGLPLSPEQLQSVRESLVAAMVEVEKTLALLPKFSIGMCRIWRRQTPSTVRLTSFRPMRERLLEALCARLGQPHRPSSRSPMLLQRECETEIFTSTCCVHSPTAWSRAGSQRSKFAISYWNKA